MKKTAKFALIVALLAMMLSLFAACGSKFTCDNCQQTKTGKKNVVTIGDEKYTLCDDCYNEVKPYLDMLDGLGDLDLGDLGL